MCTGPLTYGGTDPQASFLRYFLLSMSLSMQNDTQWVSLHFEHYLSSYLLKSWVQHLTTFQNVGFMFCLFFFLSVWASGPRKRVFFVSVRTSANDWRTSAVWERDKLFFVKIYGRRPVCEIHNYLRGILQTSIQQNDFDNDNGSATQRPSGFSRSVMAT